MTTDARSECVGLYPGRLPDFAHGLVATTPFKLRRSIKPAAVACGGGPAGPVRNGRTEPRAHPYLNAVGTFTGGKIFCRKRRSHSSHSANCSLDPSESRGSSTVNPGG